MRRLHSAIPFVLALLFVAISTLVFSDTAHALRRGFIGGFGVVTRDGPTFAYHNFYSDITGEIKEGEIVYINAWDTSLYQIGWQRWAEQDAIKPIIDWRGDPMVDYVSKRGNQYYLDGEPITLPRRYITQAEQFLQNPDIDAPIIYDGTYVPVDVTAELVDASAVWYGSGEPIVATMRVTTIYDSIYIFTAPDDDAPKADKYARAGEVVSAYEIKDDRWYRIADDLWIPKERYGEELLIPEDVEEYAIEEYEDGGKWISIDLDRQQLTAWEGNEVVVSAPVKSGRYGYYTPVGVWQTYEKVPNEQMAGSDYDYLDVAWTQYFTPNRIALHSAYWHEDYNGRPGSHGCVNLTPQKGKELFMWAPLGITIVTHNAYEFDEFDIEFAGEAE
ncbi:MAG: L,D-transpeptidase [Ardenticatenaceae bacterium]